MSIQAVAWVLENSESTLADRLVLIAIANHANAGWLAWPAVNQIAQEARVGRSTVFRSLARLVESGELEMVSGVGRGNPNSYHLKGSKIGTPGVQDTKEKVQDTQIKGPACEPQNRHEPSEPSKPRQESSRSKTVTPPRRCLTCDKLEFDCVCDRGPLIQGIGRRREVEVP